MIRLLTASSLLSAALLLSGWERLDPLAVIDSPTGNAVILNNLALNSGDRIICIRFNSAQPCTRSNAEIIVSPIDDPADVVVGWGSYKNDAVIVDVSTGKLVRSDSNALNGRVGITYR